MKDRLLVVLALVAATVLPSSVALAHSTSTHHVLKWPGASPSVQWRYATNVPAGSRTAIANGAAAWNAIGRNFSYVLGAGGDVAIVDPATICSAGGNSVQYGTPTGGDAIAAATYCYYAAPTNEIIRFVITIGSAFS